MLCAVQSLTIHVEGSTLKVFAGTRCAHTGSHCESQDGSITTITSDLGLRGAGKIHGTTSTLEDSETWMRPGEKFLPERTQELSQTLSVTET